MSYLGKTYTMERHEKLDEFLTAQGVQQPFLDQILSAKHTEKLVKDGDTYTLSLTNRSESFKSGVEFDEVLGNGSTAKTTFVVDGDTITQTQKLPSGVTNTFKHKFSGDKLVVESSSTAWNGVAYRYYSS